MFQNHFLTAPKPHRSKLEISIVTLALETPSPVWTATGRAYPNVAGATTLIWVSFAVVYLGGEQGRAVNQNTDTSDGYRPLPLIVNVMPR
jgi:hypothetical protein